MYVPADKWIIKKNRQKKNHKSNKLLWHSNRQKQEKLKLCCMRDCDIGGSDDKCVTVVVLLGSQGRKKVMEWDNLENERKWRGRARTKPLKIQCYTHLYSQESGSQWAHSWRNKFNQGPMRFVKAQTPAEVMWLD